MPGCSRVRRDVFYRISMVSLMSLWGKKKGNKFIVAIALIGFRVIMQLEVSLAYRLNFISDPLFVNSAPKHIFCTLRTQGSFHDFAGSNINLPRYCTADRPKNSTT